MKLDDDSIGKEPGTKVFYIDLFIFSDHLQDIIDYKGEGTVRANIQAYLRGDALKWFTTEFTDFEEFAPLAIFKPRASEALDSIHKLRYGYPEIRSGQTPRHFIQEVMRHARAANLESHFNILTIAWNRLDLPLRRDIREPKETTTLA